MFAAHRQVGQILDTVTSSTKTAPMAAKKPFVFEYQPGKTFPNDNTADEACRQQIAKVLAESFIHREPIVNLTGLPKKTIEKIAFGRLKQLEEFPGIVVLAGYVGPEEDEDKLSKKDFIPFVSGAAVAIHASLCPPVGVHEPTWNLIEHFLEECDDAVRPVDQGDNSLIVEMVGVLPDAYESQSKLQIVLTMEKMLISKATHMGYTSIRTVNTSPVTQVSVIFLYYAELRLVPLIYVYLYRPCQRNWDMRQVQRWILSSLSNLTEFLVNAIT